MLLPPLFINSFLLCLWWIGIALLTLKDCHQRKHQPQNEIDSASLRELEESLPRWPSMREILLNPRTWAGTIVYIAFLLIVGLFFWPGILVGTAFLKREDR